MMGSGSFVQWMSCGSSDQARHWDSCMLSGSPKMVAFSFGPSLVPVVNLIDARADLQCGAGEAAEGVGAVGCGCEGDGEVLPVKHVGAGGVVPAHVPPGRGEGVVLEEHVVTAVVVDGAVGIVHPVVRGEEMELRAVGVGGDFICLCEEAVRQRGGCGKGGGGSEELAAGSKGMLQAVSPAYERTAFGTGVERAALHFDL